MSQLEISRGSTTRAYCEGCEQLLPGSMRERVRQHVKRTGHTAHYFIEDRTTYRPAEEKP